MIGLGGGGGGNELILASGSPRRSQLLAEAGVKFQVIVPGVEEFTGKDFSARELAVRNAALKAGVVSTANPGRYVLGADTVVVLDSEVLGKPRDLEEARSFLARLSGRVHEVLTGVAICHGARTKTFTGASFVKFRELSVEDIGAYLAEVQVLDKAGGYAIQEQGTRIVERVEGEVANVMGLPVALVLENLARMGFPTAKG